MRPVILLVLLSFCSELSAQYFGRNKPRYRDFKFEVKATEHFDIYYYMDNPEFVDRLGQWSEMWYDHHYSIFEDSIEFQNPIMFYNNHADFQQNNAISSSLGPGTGGVTEAFKNRVVMPVTFTHQQTNHVLGHELVHAFQFNNIVRGDSTGLKNLANLPIWMSEGLAEYMSLGSEDSHTAMWMRDAVANDDVPEIHDMNGYRYFPYRYGHALWSFIAGFYGEEVIEPLYQNTGKLGLDYTLDSLFSSNSKAISGMWKSSLKTKFDPLIENRDEQHAGRLLANSGEEGLLNVSPVVSPNGKYFVFLSNQDLLSTDLFLGETRKGEVVKKLVSLDKGGADHIDFLESTGSWSPDSKKYVYVIFAKGKNALVMINVESGKKEDAVYIPDVPALTHPDWSPDGKSIVFTGKKEGQVDLFRYNIRSGKTEQLTDDIFSEIRPKHNVDGSKIVFSYDRRSYEYATYDGMYTLDLAEMDLSSRAITTLPVFQGADNISATYDHNNNIVFVSDRDGFKDAYVYDTNSKEVFRLTTLKTGLSGITRYSPCISAARKTDRILTSLYYNKSYKVLKTKQEQLKRDPVNANLVDKVAAELPVRKDNAEHLVDKNLAKQSVYAFAQPSTFKDVPYKPQFKLDHIGGGAGVGVNNNDFGTDAALQGGIQGLFSDVLGNHQLFAGLALNGELIDAGGQVTYINRSKRLAYGIGLGHVPLRTSSQNFVDDVVEINDQELDVLRRDLNIFRLFNESLNGFVHFPFSTTLRFEAGLRGYYQSFRQDLTQEFYATDNLGRLQLIGEQKMRVDTEDEIRINQYYTLAKGFGASANVALVGDNSTFGMTGPIAGHRFRLSLDYQGGIDNYVSSLIDLRKYTFNKPFTFAFRLTNYNRFEGETNTVFPFFIGNRGFVRGYLDVNQDAFVNPEINFERMFGNKLALASAEVRLPFLGPKQLAVIKSRFLFSDLIAFFDAGVAFNDFNQFSDGRVTNVVATDAFGVIIRDENGRPLTELQVVKPLVAMSTGVSMRIVLGGYIILEPYYARQLVKNGRWDFGLNFIPGW